MSYACCGCERTFSACDALLQHCRDKEHDASPYCPQCDRHFSDWSSRDQHYRDAAVHQELDGRAGGCYQDDEEDDPDQEPYCHGCRRCFPDLHGLDQHLATSSRHNWCFGCSKDFSSPEALQQHESSRVHSARDFDCPLCGRSFKQPSAIAHHVESGFCPRALGVHRNHVADAVHRLNIVPTISITRRIPGGPSSTPTIVTYTATNRAWNEDAGAYECYLCHRTFGNLGALNAHLHSPAHDRDEFRCPGKKCGRMFKVVSALIQHIEREACCLARFEQREYRTRASRMLKS